MSDRADGLKQFFPGAPREWVERLVESDDSTDELTGGGGQINVTDNGQNVSTITATKTQPADAGANPAAILVRTVLGEPGIRVTDEDDTYVFEIKNNFVGFVPKSAEAPPSFYSFGVRTRQVADTSDGGSLWISGGSTSAGDNGGDVYVFAGSGTVTKGKLVLGPFNTEIVEIGAAAVPVEIKGELTIGGVKFLVVTSDPNGSVTAPRGSIATNTTDGALYSNTDGGTTWVAR